MALYLILDEQTGLLLFLFFIVLLAWKPETLPVIARELGKWYREAKKVIDDFTRELYQYNRDVYTGIDAIRREVSQSISQTLSVDPDILRIAKTLGINTEGKTKDQIVSEILKKLSESGKQG